MPEPNATPAPLTMTREQEDEDRKSVFLTGHPRLLRALAELDATRAKLAEAEARYSAMPKVECACHPGVRWPSAHWGQTCALTAAESRVAPLTEALTALMNSVATVLDAQCVNNNGGAVLDSALATARAALSPSQDAKDGGA